MDRRIKLFREKSSKLFVAVNVSGQADLDVKYIDAINDDNHDKNIAPIQYNTTKDLPIIEIVGGVFGCIGMVVLSACATYQVNFYRECLPGHQQTNLCGLFKKCCLRTPVCCSHRVIEKPGDYGDYKDLQTYKEAEGLAKGLANAENKQRLIEKPGDYGDYKNPNPRPEYVHRPEAEDWTEKDGDYGDYTNPKPRPIILQQEPEKPGDYKNPNPRPIILQQEPEKPGDYNNPIILQQDGEKPEELYGEELYYTNPKSRPELVKEPGDYSFHRPKAEDGEEIVLATFVLDGDDGDYSSEINDILEIKHPEVHSPEVKAYHVSYNILITRMELVRDDLSKIASAAVRPGQQSANQANDCYRSNEQLKKKDYTTITNFDDSIEWLTKPIGQIHWRLSELDLLKDQISTSPTKKKYLHELSVINLIKETGQAKDLLTDLSQCELNKINDHYKLQKDFIEYYQQEVSLRWRQAQNAKSYLLVLQKWYEYQKQKRELINKTYPSAK